MIQRSGKEIYSKNGENEKQQEENEEDIKQRKEGVKKRIVDVFQLLRAMENSQRAQEANHTNNIKSRQIM